MGSAAASGSTLLIGASGSFPSSTNVTIYSPSILALGDGFTQSINRLLGIRPPVPGTDGELMLGSADPATTLKLPELWLKHLAASCGAGALILDGSNLTLTGSASTYSGQTTVIGGRLQTGVVNAFSLNSNVSLQASSTLNLNTFSSAILNLLDNGAGQAG